jgi:hypothetical protein
MLSSDNYVNGSSETQSFNRYTYAANNPMSFTDPTGDFLWFVPVIIGAVAGSYVGGAIQQGNGGLAHANWDLGSWDNTAWKGIAVGAIAGAGLGLGFSASFATLGGPVTGISAGQTGFAVSGATTTGWNIGANALLTANIDMASRGLQGGGWGQAAAAGAIGLGAGALGGAFASLNTFQVGGVMSLQGIRAQNYATNILNGIGDRMYRSLDAGLGTGEVISNSILGGMEGFTSAWMTNVKRFGPKRDQVIELNPLKYAFVNARDRWSHASARYLSSFLTGSVTSVPGAAFQVGSAYWTIAGAAYSGGNMLGSVLSAGLLWGPSVSLASSILDWSGAWDSYGKIGGFKPFTIW